MPEIVSPTVNENSILPTKLLKFIWPEPNVTCIELSELDLSPENLESTY